MDKNNKNRDQQPRPTYRRDKTKKNLTKDTPPEEKTVSHDDIRVENNAHDTGKLLEPINFIKNALTSLTSLANTKFAKEKDVKDVADFVIDARNKIYSVDKKLDDVISPIFSEVQNLRRDMNNLPRRNDVTNSINSAAQNLRAAVVDESGQSVIKSVKIISKIQDNFRKSTDARFVGLEKGLKNIADSTEVIQSLPGKIDGIAQILSDKGLQLKQDFPAINHDEETLAELTECAEKILQQLSIAARWYARKLPELNAHEESIKDLTAANEQAVNQARKEGEERGRKSVIRELLGAYDDLHKLMNPTDDTVLDQLKILATFLKNAGVEPIYEVGQSIEITDGDLISYEHNIANLKPGKIAITSPGYAFNSDTIEKAKYMPYEDFIAAQKISEPQDDDSSPEENVQPQADETFAVKIFSPQTDDSPPEQSAEAAQVTETKDNSSEG